MHTEAHLFSVPNDCLWYDKLWGPSQRVVTLFIGIWKLSEYCVLSFHIFVFCLFLLSSLCFFVLLSFCRSVFFCLFVFSSIRHFVILSFCLFRLSVFLSLCIEVFYSPSCLFIFQSFGLCMFVFLCRSVCLSFSLSFFIFVYLRSFKIVLILQSHFVPFCGVVEI